MANLHADENLPLMVVQGLIEFGHDVTTREQAGLGISDADVLRYAASTGRILITLNRRDFIRIHQKSPNHAGIIICTVDADIARLTERIHQTIISEANMTGRLVRIIRPSS